jgi:pimeloyl-ACP methyl ester carboxylesterase
MARLAYRMLGPDGPTLTLLHGGFVHSHTWDPHLPALTAAARVIAPDLRGYGGSERVEEPWSVADVAADVAALWDELGIEQSYVVGFSQGGLVALDLALSESARVQGLVLVSTTSAFDDARREAWAAHAAGYSPSQLPKDAEFHVQSCFTPEYAAAHPEEMSWYRSLLADADPTSVRNTISALARADYSRRLAEIHCPALVVYGTADTSTGPEYGRPLAEGLRAREVVVEGARHNLHLEQPDLFVRLVLDFVRQHESRESATEAAEVH